MSEYLNDLAADISIAMTGQGFWKDWDRVHLALIEITRHINSSKQQQQAAVPEAETELEMLQAFRRSLISEKLMLMSTEISEAMEALRKNRRVSAADMERLRFGELHEPDPSCEFNKTPFEKYVKDTLEDEIADLFIRALDFCGKLNIDIDWHIEQKSIYNATRPRRHGKEC